MNYFQAAGYVFDWQSCLVCQTKNSEKESCPANSKDVEKIDVIYRNFVHNVTHFKSLGMLPQGFSFESYDDEDAMVQTLITNKAVWHKKCHQKFNNDKLKRARS